MSFQKCLITYYTQYKIYIINIKYETYLRDMKNMHLYKNLQSNNYI